MKTSILLIASLFLYVQVLTPLVQHLDGMPYVQKLGYVPQEKILRFSTVDQKTSYAAALVFKTMMYFGGLVEESAQKNIQVSTDYDGMAQNIKSVTRLDPYNMDAYYFAQAILTWDVGRIAEANELLEYGMQYRPWDFYLPYFAGFNYAYFLKDYENAARYYQRAAELTGDELLVRLTSRYLYEARKTELAIAYLKTMSKGARNAAVKKSLEARLQAMTGIRQIEAAVKEFQGAKNRLPVTLNELISAGYLNAMPVDPYGGEFFLDADGKVRTTSKLAAKEMQHESN